MARFTLHEIRFTPVSLPAQKLRDPGPVFARPRQLELSVQQQDEIAKWVLQTYTTMIQARNTWTKNHLEFDQMFRGTMPARDNKPWPGAADLHIQMPYWLVDAINVRQMISIWNQNPLVAAYSEEDDDQDKALRAAKLVEWHLQPKRMSARNAWSRMSKIRDIHGCDAGLISYVHDFYKYRTQTVNTDREPVFLGNDDQGVPLYGPAIDEQNVTGTLYHGPILHPLDWDDFVAPVDCLNLQPQRAKNPGGAPTVHVRQWENFSLMQKKARATPEYDPPYQFLMEDGRTKQWWISAAPSQDFSSSGSSGENNQRARAQAQQEGVNRGLIAKGQREKQDPKFEIITCFTGYQDPNDEDEHDEFVFFVSKEPTVLLGAFYLSDISWTGTRPLLELHYQKVGTRFYSMGVMEIARHLSAELDTIHNMRMDVGFATNLPWFFYKAASGFNPDEISLRPMKGVPVDDPRNFSFPQFANVTTFYLQEEAQLFTLVERVLGVTDLFLGISPTRGASARHATGFVGTQMEAEARMSDILDQDAEAFSFLCQQIVEMEYQYGPEYREFRLFGDAKSPDKTKLSRDDIWYATRYDYRLGANTGFLSHAIKQQQAQAILGLKSSSPLMMQDMGRLWEAEAFYLRSIGIRNPEQFLGPKDAVAQASPKKQDEENAEMAQYQFGVGIPAPVHPQDNDMQHSQDTVMFLSGEVFNQLGRPNQQAFLAHLALHQRQIATKQQFQQAQAMTALGAPGQPGGNGSGMSMGASPMARASAQLANVPATMGTNLGEMPLSQTGPQSSTILTPPAFGGRL